MSYNAGKKKNKPASAHWTYIYHYLPWERNKKKKGRSIWLNQMPQDSNWTRFMSLLDSVGRFSSSNPNRALWIWWSSFFCWALSATGSLNLPVEQFMWVGSKKKKKKCLISFILLLVGGEHWRKTTEVGKCQSYLWNCVELSSTSFSFILANVMFFIFWSVIIHAYMKGIYGKNCYY